MLHENSVMLRDTDILPDNTYTHVNNGSQTCSWLDHIAHCNLHCCNSYQCLYALVGEIKCIDLFIILCDAVQITLCSSSNTNCDQPNMFL